MGPAALSHSTHNWVAGPWASVQFLSQILQVGAGRVASATPRVRVGLHYMPVPGRVQRVDVVPTPAFWRRVTALTVSQGQRPRWAWSGMDTQS